MAARKVPQSNREKPLVCVRGKPEFYEQHSEGNIDIMISLLIASIYGLCSTFHHIGTQSYAVNFVKSTFLNNIIYFLTLDKTYIVTMYYICTLNNEYEITAEVY